MKYEQLIKKFAKLNNIDFEESAQFIDAFFSTIKLGLSHKEKVKISKFGIFSPKTFKSRLVKNKETGEIEAVPETVLPHFVNSRKKEPAEKKSKKEKPELKIYDIKEEPPSVAKIKFSPLLKRIVLLFIIFSLINITIISIAGLKFLKSRYIKNYLKDAIEKYLYEKGITYNGITEIVDTKFQEVLNKTEEYNQQIVTTLKTQLIKLKQTQEESFKKLQKMEKILKKRIEKMIAPALRRRKKKAEVKIILYTVKKNDTLWALSKKFMNNPYNWVGIYKTNGEKIKDPDKIYPGQKIFIPVIKEKD